MAKELFLKQREELLSELVNKFILLEKKSELFHKKFPEVDLRVVSDELKAEYERIIKAPAEEVYRILTKIGEINLSIKDLDNGRNPSQHYEIAADEYTQTIEGELIPRILRVTGETGNLGVIKGYEDYFLNQYDICNRYDSDNNLTKSSQILVHINVGFFQYRNIQQKERVNSLKAFLEELKNTAQENEKPTIDKLLEALGTREEKGEYSEQLGRFENNEDADFPMYYQKFLNEEAKDLLDEQSKIINEKPLEQLNLVDIYNQIARAYKKVDDERLKAAMLVFADALTLMNDHSCSPNSQELLKEIIQNTNWLLKSKPTDPGYDQLTENYNKLLEKVNEKASKNAQSGFWKQLGGTMLLFLGAIILTAAIVFAVLTLPAAIATGAVITAIAISVGSASTAAVGLYIAYKGGFFAKKGERESQKANAFGYLLEDMKENQKYFSYELGKLREKEETLLNDVLSKASEILKSGHAPENKVKEFNISLSKYRETMRNIARIEKALERNVSFENVGTMGGEDLGNAIKNSKITEELVENDSNGKNIRNLTDLSGALSLSANFVRYYVNNPNQFNNYLENAVNQHNQRNPNNLLDLNQVKNDENKIKIIQKGFLDQLINLHVRNLGVDHSDRNVIQKYKPIIEETFLNSVNQRRLNKEIEEKVESLKNIIGDEGLEGFSGLEIPFVNRLREILAPENISNVEKLESIEDLFKPFNKNQESLGKIIDITFYENIYDGLSNDERINFKLGSIAAELAKINQEDGKLSESQRNFVDSLLALNHEMVMDNENNPRVLTNNEKIDRVLALSQQAKDNGVVLKPILENKKILEVEHKLKEPDFNANFQAIPGVMTTVAAGLMNAEERLQEERRNGPQAR